jgi:NADH-quinone oxidoreductase subunit J
MTLYTITFYVVAAVIVVSTGLAITRNHPIHSVIYLVVSFLGSGVLFFLLGAPFLAAVEVIVYAGAIMVLFLFVIMMFKVEGIEVRGFPWRQWGPAILTAILFLSVAGLLAFGDPSGSGGLTMHMVSPKVCLREVLACH